VQVRVRRGLCGMLPAPQNTRLGIGEQARISPPTATPNDGTVRGYQRDLRDFGGQQTGARLSMQPSGLNIYAS
jgi:hypothetical protein